MVLHNVLYHIPMSGGVKNAQFSLSFPPTAPVVMIFVVLNTSGSPHGKADGAEPLYALSVEGRNRPGTPFSSCERSEPG